MSLTIAEKKPVLMVRRYEMGRRTKITFPYYESDIHPDDLNVFLDENGFHIRLITQSKLIKGLVYSSQMKRDGKMSGRFTYYSPLFATNKKYMGSASFQYEKDFNKHFDYFVNAIMDELRMTPEQRLALAKQVDVAKHIYLQKHRQAMQCQPK